MSSSGRDDLNSTICTNPAMATLHARRPGHARASSCGGAPARGRSERLVRRQTVLCEHQPMASGGTATGTVRLWMVEDGWGVIDVPDLPGGCWAETSVVEGLDGASGLRSGQTVDVDWT